MRCPEKIIYQHLYVRITLNLGTVHYQKCQEYDNVLLVSYYTMFFTDTGGLNTHYTEEEL